MFTEWKSVTGGIGGLTNIPPARLFGFDVTRAGAFPGAVADLPRRSSCCVIRALVRSSFGRSLKAIRDDETAAWAYGKNVAIIKTTAVVVSSALAAVAGSLYAFYLSFINVESFVLETSVQLMAMVIIGGTATLFGPVIGAVLILLLPAGLSYLPYLPPTEIGSIQQIVYGLAMVLLMIYRPGRPVGLPGEAAQPARAARHEPGRRDPAPGRASVAKTFGGLKAVDDVSFSLRAGIITTLVGPNGAGKTTLFNLMTGHLVPDRGEVTWLGKSILGLPHWKIARLGHRPLLPGPQAVRQHDGGGEHRDRHGARLLAVADRAVAPPRRRARDTRRARRSPPPASATSATRAPSISAYAERKFLSLARIMASGARLWLLDEPASGLDRGSYERFLSLLRNAGARGRHHLHHRAQPRYRAGHLRPHRLPRPGPAAGRG